MAQFILCKSVCLAFHFTGHLLPSVTALNRLPLKALLTNLSALPALSPQLMNQLEQLASNDKNFYRIKDWTRCVCVCASVEIWTVFQTWQNHNGEYLKADNEQNMSLVKITTKTHPCFTKLSIGQRKSGKKRAFLFGERANTLLKDIHSQGIWNILLSKGTWKHSAS